jgi:glycosyltransferase involved in cell wall biosynthesis
MVKISACIVARNEGRKIRGCLESLKGAVDEIVVVDGKSTDDTVEICRGFGGRVFEREPRSGYGDPDRVFALAKAKGDWILVLDADERLSGELRRNVRKLASQNEFAGYMFPRMNYVFSEERWLSHGDEYPDYQVRFYRKDAVKYDTRVHGRPLVSGKVGVADYPILHKQAPQTFGDLWKRCLAYAKIAAAQDRGGIPRTLRPLNGAFWFAWRFVVGFFVRRGFLDGMDGFKVALMHALYQFITNWYLFWQGPGKKVYL